MRWRTWPLAAAGLAMLLILVVLSMLAASRRAREIYNQLSDLNAHHAEVDAKLRKLRADVQLSGIYIRDYLLDTSAERGPEYRARLAELRRSNMSTVEELRAVARKAGSKDPHLDSLTTKLDEYWEGFEPLFDWTLVEKITRSARFLRREVLPRRDAVLSIAGEIEQLNNANLAAQRAEVARRETAFNDDLHRLLWQSLLLGLLVAAVVTMRLRVLEHRSEQQHAATRDAEMQMRGLSQQLVATQEDERRKLSRELHDHVGQMLTALRMELGRIDRLRAADASLQGAAVAESKKIVDQILDTVRNLSLGLRPSMLDDFGLQPALEWHARNFTRHHDLPVTLQIDGPITELSDRHRTCVYRIVQEALTNCARHAHATQVRVRVTADSNTLHLVIDDDGVGMHSARRRAGLGLRGMEERVRELHGRMVIASAPGKGTSISVDLPLGTFADEVPRAAAAG